MKMTQVVRKKSKLQNGNRTSAFGKKVRSPKLDAEEHRTLRNTRRGAKGCEVRSLKYVWLIENGRPVSYLGTQVTVNFTNLWFICKTVRSKGARVINLDKVFLSKQLAIESLVKFDCWYIDGDRIVSAYGHRRGDGSIIVFDKSERELRYVRPFTTLLKAERQLLHDLRAEKTRSEKRIREIDRATLRLQKNRVRRSR